jgi:hypothetical protein
MTFTAYERPVRAAFVGLGRIYDLNVRAYLNNPDVEVVALVDPSEERRSQRQADWPQARTFASAAELAERLRMARQPAETHVQRPRRCETHARRRRD